MRARCLFNRRLLTGYLDGELPPGRTARVENHLAKCGVCRDQYVRLRSARFFAKQLPDRAPGHDLWPALERVLEDRGKREASQRKPLVQWPRKRPSYISLATAIVGIVMMGIGVSLAISGGSRGAGEHEVSRKIEPELGLIDANNFRRVSIDRIKDSIDPHIAAEGYVSDLNVDKEDGDLTFRLVSDPSQPQSFVVCEIIDSIKVQPPRPGSRIRVYGVSRFDGQAGHNWYEVHPVLGIEPATR